MTETGKNKQAPIYVSGFMEISEIPECYNNEWQLLVDGKPVDFRKMVILSSKYGRIVLGYRVRDGFVGPVSEEEGGVIILLTSKTADGTELAGGILEIRYNMDAEGKPVLCALGGMRLQGEDLCPVVKEKIHTKVPGLSTKGIKPYEIFPKINTDRLYKAADVNTGKGAISAFELSIPFEELEKLPDGSYGLAGVEDVRFWPLYEAPWHSGDALFNTLIAYRFATLAKQKK